MSATFSQTTRALDSDSAARGIGAAVVLLSLLVAWTVWLLCAEVTEWAVSETARIEVARAAHPIDAPVGGRIVSSRMVLGAEVHAGDIVIEIDSESERRRLAEERTRLGAFEPALEALRRMLAAQEQVLTSERGVTVTTIREGQARQREAEAASRLATEEAKRAGTLFDGGSIAELDWLRANTQAERSKGVTDALGFGVERRRGELRTAETRDIALVEQLHKDTVDLEGRRAVTAAAIDLLTFEIERRRLVAPVDGRVADAPTLRLGAYVREGERLGSIVPIGNPKLVAAFAPSTALGRVRAGQTARARVDSFPWIEYGTVPAHVGAIGSEPREGRVRVELDIDIPGNERIAVEHGLVCSVEVAVGKTTPAKLLLRAIGRALAPPASPPPLPAAIPVAGADAK